MLSACVALVAACDLQPRIVSLPDSVGDFISDRYPALLADPETQPEIYNSAASDYGVYASPELYGSVESDDYIMYADINDYMFPAQAAYAPAATAAPEEARVVAQYSAPDDEPAAESAETPDEYLVVPMYGGARDSHQIKVVAGDTLYTIARRYGATVEEVAKMNNMSAPYSLRVGQTLRVPGNGDIVASAASVDAAARQPSAAAPKTETPAPARSATPPTPARVQLQTVTVGAGDTLYSISRKYSVPVNDLAVMNDLVAPFRLTVGQKLRVPNLQAAAAAKAQAAPASASSAASEYGTPKKAEPARNATPVKSDAAAKNNLKKEPQKQAPAQSQKTAAAPKAKISSNPKQKLPVIAARSSSKFSWPVRGKILSAFGAKPNGLVNDGINIAASRGATVKAAENGVVAYAGNEVKGMGNLIIIQHSGGWMTVYAHLDSIGLRRGARVNVGQKIGTVGASGKVDRPQLHFEIRKGTKAYNPSQYLKK